MTETIVETAATRLAGQRPGRGRALLVAVAAGVGAGVLVYKLLRSGGDAGS